MPRWVGYLSNWVGLGTWLLVGVPMVRHVLASGQPAGAGDYAWLLAWLAFGAVFGLVSTGRLDFLPPRAHRGLLGLEVALAGLIVLIDPGYGFSAVLFILTAAHAPHVLSVGQGAALVAAQTALLGYALSRFGPGGDPWVDTVQAGAYLGFQLFALFSTESALREGRARQELAKLNAELRATQALLAESSKVGERVRIARELHDLIGHQLTALSLNLEIATHTEGHKARVHVEKAKGIAKDLLADVRGVVGAMRETEVNLEAALRALVEGVPRPAIHLSLADGLTIENPEKAHALVRCVQEIITNAVRHAQAANLWIAVEDGAQGIRVHARDDGRGSREVCPGHGLSGMRERLEQFGGRLSVRSQPGEGFAVEAVLPN